ncbi:WW domain-binding protein 4 [Trichonephila inaurata madagascariensis]|uniref:WW domain-binding protein 4 n=1 Tax=Trichonephila inaurata madagascariensis TaxID=2747483 RepID=A0A8X6X971_9ARAC|nr:WW domain-binding protein 4 [Trichonephila inaurata madagascariensis]
MPKLQEKSEYWKSLPRKYCDVCKCWFADNKASIEFHERGKRHQENAQKQIQDIQKRGVKEFKKQKQLEDDMAKIEKAALAAYKKDLQNFAEILPNSNPDLIDNTIANLSNNVELSRNCKSTEPKKFKQNVIAKKEKTSNASKPVKVKKEVLETNSNVSVKQEEVTETRKWHEAMSDEGYKYYWNVENSESRWEPPEEGYISIEEQAQLNSQAVTENDTPQIKEEPKEEEENNNCVEPSSFGPQPKVDPYGQWITIEKKEPVEIDLQLPKPSENIVEVVIPLSKDNTSLKFKEKIVGHLEDTDPSETVTFKKRKFFGLSGKRNTRQRNLDDD